MTKLAAVLALAFCSAAWAQTGELWFSAGDSLLQSTGMGTDLCPIYVTGMICRQSFGGTPNDIALTNGFRFSFRGAFNQGDHLGHEIQYAYNRTNLKFNGSALGTPLGSSGFEEGMAFHQVGYNLLYYLNPEGSKVRWFGTAGVNVDTFVPPGTSISYGGGSTKFGMNFGGGVKIRLSHLFGIRFDGREYFSGKPSFGFDLKQGLLWQTELTAGFGIGF
jgi:hypothetical protein